MRIFDTIQRLHDSLDYHAARHNVLTANLAHIDTPGYRPLELERTFHNTLQAEMKAPGHIAVGSARGSGRVIEDPSMAEGGDGNRVNLDREAVKVAANNIRYDVVSTLVSGALSSLSWAASDGRNG